MDDSAFAAEFASSAARIPGVVAVALGGSRALGVATAESDWDFAIYYRGQLNPDDVRRVGWEGDVFAPGDWGGGVMNGGAFLRVGGRKVDLHYRDLVDVEHRIAQASAGRFDIERLPLYLAGVPTYLPVAELGVARVLHGSLPRPPFPEALRSTGYSTWHEAAGWSLRAAAGFAARQLAAECLGWLARAALEEAHARTCRDGVWVVNEKRLLALADLADVRDAFLGVGETGLDARVELVARRIGH